MFFICRLDGDFCIGNQDNQVLIDWAETRGNKQDDERGVYVLNVDENVEDADFKAHFEKHGTIEKVKKHENTHVFFSSIWFRCSAVLCNSCADLEISHSVPISSPFDVQYSSRGD